ncbi:hypothetical protein AJ78_01446 [Emergomyces pasteurianus Ep9510]|uniref:K Homology domain-containing protein n=1 Tax=Emergomyces pasteurianus Ep9510 TaxID=1447872 RepID=A0A1J9PRI8_9EURO|nr:hypothetical protein AJ78_01446 [Emergomyces pasteurianus Ep9510]
MLSGTRQGLRRVSFFQTPVEHATVSCNDPFLPFLYPRELFSTLAQGRYMRHFPFPLVEGSNRVKGSISNCYRQARSNPHRTSRKYTPASLTPHSASTVSSVLDSSQAEELKNHDSPAYSREPDIEAPRQYDTRSSPGSTQPGSSAEQSADVYRNADAIGPDSRGVVRQVRAEKWWRKELPRELVHKPSSKQSHLYMEWMDIMDEIMDLRRATKDKPAPAYAKTIYLSESDVVALAGDERENVWDIRVLSGCRIHVLPREPNSGDPRRKVVLTGSPEAVRLAEEEIQAGIEAFYAAEGIVPESLPPFVAGHEWKQSHNVDVPKIRSVWTHNVPLMAQGKRSRNPIRADGVSRPESWTVRNFADYLESITNLAFSSPVHSFLYPNGELNRDVILDIICDLFTNPDTQQFLSTRAVNSVVFYCYRYPQYLPTLLSLFPNFEHLMTTRTFNALLAGCSTNHDLNRFRYLISLMKRCGVRPNGLEWVAFVDTIFASSVRQKVVARLRREGLLEDQRVLRRLMYRVIPDSLTSHLESGQSVDDYFAVMDKRYGRAWICTESIKHMLSVTVRLDDLNAAHTIIHFSKKQGIQLDGQCMNYCLALHLNKKLYSRAISFYLNFANDFPGLPVNNETIRILFTAAWRAKYYNTCRVIWTYACLWGLVSNGMKHMVLSSLLRNTVSTPGDDVEKNWVINAGKAIAGIEINTSDIGQGFEILKGAAPNPDQELLGSDNVMSLLIGYQPAGKLRDGQRQFAHWVIKRDCEAAWRFNPRSSFGIMMWEANALDIGWWADGHAASMTTAEVVRDVIKVPVDKRPGWRKREKDKLVSRNHAKGKVEEGLGQKRQLELQPREPKREPAGQPERQTEPHPVREQDW